jgi:uncharacterized membrane protein (DUF106 family)
MEENQGCIRSCVGCGCSTVGTAVSVVITFAIILVGLYVEASQQRGGDQRRLGIMPVKQKSVKATKNKATKMKRKAKGKGKKRR